MSEGDGPVDEERDETDEAYETSGEPEGEDENQPVYDYPWWVRVLAVAHVLSLIGGPAGFMLLISAAALRRLMLGRVDGDVVTLAIAGAACPVLCAAYRSWFVRWGRSRWPDVK
ncbi:MAG: hypothetical protein ACT4QC_06360 [Planctomycetaceae bacterium]